MACKWCCVSTCAVLTKGLQTHCVCTYFHNRHQQTRAALPTTSMRATTKRAAAAAATLVALGRVRTTRKAAPPPTTNSRRSSSSSSGGTRVRTADRVSVWTTQKSQNLSVSVSVCVVVLSYKCFFWCSTMMYTGVVQLSSLLACVHPTYM